MNDDIPADGLPTDDDRRAGPVWRAALSAVETPGGARDAAISAALAEFDAAARIAPVVELSGRRRRQLQFVGAAAAVVVVAAGVITLVGGTRDDAPVAVEKTTEVPRTVGDAAGAEASEAAPAADAATPLGTIASIDGPAVASADAAGAAASAEATLAPLPSGVAVPPALDDVDALAAYAAAVAPGTGATVADSPCAPERSEVLGLVLFRGTEAVVARDISGTVVALDADTCVVLASITP